MKAVELAEGLRPDRRQATDVLVSLVLCALGVYGFRTSFAGHEELLVGLPAVTTGGLTGYALVRRRVTLLPGVAIGAVAFVLLGGLVALRADALFGFLPTLAVLDGLADGLRSGWMRLLTTVPPAGEAGNLLAVPYVVGFVGAASTVVLALRVDRWSACLLPPVMVLAVSLAFGTARPASLLLQGAAFGALSIGWISLRTSRYRQVVTGGTSRRRLAAGAAMLGVVAVVAPLLGPWLPGADSRERFVLREHVTPPFDPLIEASPLAGYRRYTGAELEKEPVLEVAGLPAGVPVRLAVLDDFDGLVWRATGTGSALAGSFERVGEQLPAETDGSEVEVEVTILRPHGVWLPTVGDVARIRFADDRDDTRAEGLRYNLATETAALPAGTRAGERYTVTAVAGSLPPEADLVQLPIDRRIAPASAEQVPTAVQSLAAELAGGAETPYGQVMAMAAALRSDGAFSDGGPDATVVTPPGHSLSRLVQFLGSPQWVGNGEQYAAALALLATGRGIPVRVVMGFLPDGDEGTTTIRGEHVQAWVEVPLEGVGWVPVTATPPRTNVPDPQVQPRPRQLNPEPQPPPPPAVPPPASVPQDLAARDADADDEIEEDEDAVGSSLLGWIVVVGVPAAALAAPVALILLVKRRRRRRRRTRGQAWQRVHGGWQEVVDVARDLGRPVAPHATRREASVTVRAEGALLLAERADAATFGATEPTEEDVAALWRQVDAVLDEMRGQVGTAERLRAAVRTTSLRRPRG